MNLKLLSVAKGETPADLVIRNGKIVNVYSGEIYEGGVAVCGDTIAAVGDVDYCVGENTRVVDAEGKYLTPGFLDGHIHPESSSLAIRSFAEAVLSHGTTGIMTDLHEVGVVSGLEGIEAILKEAETTDLKLYFVVPSPCSFPCPVFPQSRNERRTLQSGDHPPRASPSGRRRPVGMRRPLYYGGLPRPARVV